MQLTLDIEEENIKNWIFLLQAYAFLLIKVQIIKERYLMAGSRGAAGCILEFFIVKRNVLVLQHFSVSTIDNTDSNHKARQTFSRAPITQGKVSDTNEYLITLSHFINLS